ncbi:MAG: hypothetical protein RL885_02755 [Planctomycetota bacterium]
MTGEGKKRRRRRIDWDKIRLDFVTDPTATLRSIARRHDVERCALSKRAKSEGWKEEREDFQRQAAEATKRAAIDVLRTRVVEQWQRLLTDVESARRAAVEAIIEEELQDVEEITTTQDGATRRTLKRRRIALDSTLAAGLLRAEVAALSKLSGTFDADSRETPELGYDPDDSFL